MSKGSKRRPPSVDRKIWEDNFDKVFGVKKGVVIEATVPDLQKEREQTEPTQGRDSA